MHVSMHNKRSCYARSHAGRMAQREDVYGAWYICAHRRAWLLSRNLLRGFLRHNFNLCNAAAVPALAGAAALRQLLWRLAIHYWLQHFSRAQSHCIGD